MSRRRALLIACSDYSDSKLLPLAGATADARDLRSVLLNREISDFEVEVVENPTSYEFSRIVERFYQETKLNDLALVYCSCHGVKAPDGRLYLAATNTETAYLASTSVPASFLQEQIANCRSKQKVLVLDCCYAGAFMRGARHRGSATVTLSDAFSGGKGTVYIASSGATQYSWEGDHMEGEPRPSLFTQCLIQGLESGEADLNKDGLVGVRELFDYVVDELHERTPLQRPEFSCQEYVEIYLAKTPPIPEPIIEPEPDPEPIPEPEPEPEPAIAKGFEAPPVSQFDLTSAPQVTIPPVVTAAQTPPVVVPLTTSQFVKAPQPPVQESWFTRHLAWVVIGGLILAFFLLFAFGFIMEIVRH